MKREIILIFAALLVLFLTLMAYTSIKKLQAKDAMQDTQSDLREMLYQLGHADSEVAPFTILIYFNSECEHCQREIHEISKNIGLFDRTQLLLTSFEPQQEAFTFLAQHDLSDLYLRSTPENVIDSFSGGVPQTLIYQEGELIKHFKGEVKVSAILKVIATK